MLGEREERKWQVRKVEEERKRIIDEGEEKVEGEGKGERVGEKEKRKENEGGTEGIGKGIMNREMRA